MSARRLARGRAMSTRGEGGFTLVELMVVVLIIGILIAIALPTFLGARERAQDRAAQADLRTGLAAALTYFADDGDFTGFNVAEAEATEASLDWIGGGAPAVGQISIEVASGRSLLLVGQSRTTRFFCLAQKANSPATDRGSGDVFADVDTVNECDGGW